ncbi:protein Wnt-9a-like [Scylla paramamosain]|uniref:protein Wnt-9a-like n=1 Tax=Scylla paramamosain TaxID=85552 RepID=UPI003083ECE2
MRPFCFIVAVSHLLHCLAPHACHAFCGISSRRKVDQTLLTSTRSASNFSMDLRTKCEYAGVHGAARRACLRSREMAGVLLEAAWMGVTHCQHLMLHERWNCSLGRSRRRIMKQAFPETAFLQALSAASVTQVVSRSCAQGHLTRCSCDNTASATPADSRRAWRWGGCGDNVRYGQKLAERFFIGKRKDGRKKEGQTSAELKAAVSQEYSRSRDFKSQIDVHNACVGIKTVASAAKKTCKCHGPSGSCVMKTCWIQLPAFIASGETLKSLYQRSSLGRTINEAQITNRASRPRYPRTSGDRRLKGHGGGTRRSGRQRGIRNNILKVSSERCVSHRGGKGWGVLGDPSQLVYLDASPNFCYKNKYGPGTRGRSCEKGQSCSDVCCGRGYDTSVAEVTEPCKCRVVWCCEVKCLNCTRVAELYTCK